MSEREITIREVADELQLRLESGKTVDCCKDELIRLCEIVKEKIGNEKIRVNWQD